MNRAEYNDLVSSFNENETRLKSLKKGDVIYEMDLQDPIGNSYFKHEVVSIDLVEMCVNTLDHSQNKKRCVLYSFSTPEEAGFIY